MSSTACVRVATAVVRASSDETDGAAAAVELDSGIDGAGGDSMVELGGGTVEAGEGPDIDTRLIGSPLALRRSYVCEVGGRGEGKRGRR